MLKMFLIVVYLQIILDIKYYTININDTADFKITPYFKEVYDFIETAFMEDDLLINDDMKNLIFAEKVNNENESQNSSFLTKKLTGEISTTSSSYDLLPTDKPENSIINLQDDEIGKMKCNHRKNNLIQKEFKKVISSKNNNRVLIHCSLGVSRSAAFSILYIMKKFSLAYENVKIIIYILNRRWNLLNIIGKSLYLWMNFLMN